MANRSEDPIFCVKMSQLPEVFFCDLGKYLYRRLSDAMEWIGKDDDAKRAVGRHRDAGDCDLVPVEGVSETRARTGDMSAFLGTSEF